MHTFIRRFATPCLVAAATLFFASTQAEAKPLRTGLWVWTDVFTSSAERETLIRRSAASGITDLYVSVYRSVPNMQGRRMYEDADMAAFIRAAKRSKLKVWASYGSPGYPTHGCGESSFSRARMEEVAAYNKANPSTKFAGVMLDVEPPEPQSEADYQALLDMYLCYRYVLPNNVKLGGAIRFFWDDLVEFPAGSGNVLPMEEHFVDLGLDAIVVMGYRDTAGTSCPSDSVICLDEVEIAAATAAHKNGLILVGLETKNCSPGCGPEKVTFFEEGQDAMNQEIQAIRDHFEGSSGFGGFAIHYYGDHYLSGAPGWPETNPSYP